MQSEVRSAARRRIGIAGWVLFLYGTTLIFFQTEVVLKLARGVMGYAGWVWGGMADLPTAWSGPTDIDSPFRAAYNVLTLRLPLLPWAAWVVGAIILMLARARHQAANPAAEVDPAPAEEGRKKDKRLLALGLIGLAVALGPGAWLRAEHLLPGPVGTWPGSNFDEMVYYTQSELLTRGGMPYRDTFMAHPPGVVLAFAPGLVFEKAWGGAAAFVAARQWLFIYSLLAIPLVWVCGRKLGGSGTAVVSALIMALDGKAAFAPESERQLPNVGVLETLVNVTSLAALAIYLYAPERGLHRRWWLLGAGALGGIAAMCKVPGFALLLALLLYTLANRQKREAMWLLMGGVAGAGIVGLPFFVVAPGQMVRQFVFFQLLRPQEVRADIDQAARVAAFPEAQLGFLLAGLGVVALAYILLQWWQGVSHGSVRWLLAGLWAAPVIAVFVLSRSFHTQYYTQLVPPLALLAGAVAARQVWRGELSSRLAFAGLIAFISLPLVVSQWRVANYVAYDTVYKPAGQIIAATLKPGEHAMAFDPGYAFAAAAPPARIPSNGNFVVDTAGYTVYAAEDLDRRSWGDIVNSVLSLKRERNEDQVLKEPKAQAALLAGAVGAEVVTLDQKIALPKLTAQSVKLLEGTAVSREAVDFATVLHEQPPTVTLLSNMDLALTASTLALASGDITPVVEPGAVSARSGEVAQLGLYWRPESSLPGDYRVVVRIVGEGGETATQIDTEPAESKEHTSQWRPGFVYPDLRNIPLTNIPVGRYSLFVRVYDPRTQATSQDVPLQQSLEVR